MDCKVVHDENLDSRQPHGERQTQTLENLLKNVLGIVPVGKLLEIWGKMLGPGSTTPRKQIEDQSCHEKVPKLERNNKSLLIQG